MSGAKETPRQKMIGMMYLVYTALLAMNVSADILDAFALVSDGQQKTNASIEMKINDQYNAFHDQYEKEQAKTQLYWDQALEIRSKTDEIVNYIEKEVKLPMALRVESLKSEADLLNPKDAKKQLVRNKEKADPKNNRVFYDLAIENFGSKDNYDVPTSMMIEEGGATVLKQKINEYRNFIIEAAHNVGLVNYDNHVGLLTDVDENGEPIKYYNANKEEVNWETKHFEHVVFAAEIAILNQMVGAIQTTEYEAVAAMMNRIGATDFKFNRLQARVIAERDYILQGEDYEAEVFLVASDTTRNFRAYYALGKGNQVETTSEGGVIKLKFKGNTLGEQTYSGVIKMTNPETGEEEDYDFTKTFTVAQPSATIAATKMNIMYSGLANPISVSAPGFTSDEINVRVTGGTLKMVNKAKGEYEVIPNSVKEEVHIFATVMKDGKSMNLCDKTYRVKSVPKPEATIGGISEGQLTKGKMIAAGKIVPKMDDFDFEGYTFQVVSYEVSMNIGSESVTIGKVTGDAFDENVRKRINNAKRGTKFIFSNIRAKAPGGETPRLNMIEITID